MKKICSIIAAIVFIATIAYLINKTPLITVEKSDDFSAQAAVFKDDLIEQLNNEEVVVTVAGSTVDEYYDFHVDDNMNLDEQLRECRNYSVEELFCCAYAPFFWQAVQIRYPEYARYNYKLHAMLGGAD